MSAKPDITIRKNVPDVPDRNIEPPYTSGTSEASSDLSQDPPAIGPRIPKDCIQCDDKGAGHPGPWDSDGEHYATPRYATIQYTQSQCMWYFRMFLARSPGPRVRECRTRG